MRGQPGRLNELLDRDSLKSGKTSSRNVSLSYRLLGSGPSQQSLVGGQRSCVRADGRSRHHASDRHRALGDGPELEQPLSVPCPLPPRSGADGTLRTRSAFFSSVVRRSPRNFSRGAAPGRSAQPVSIAGRPMRPGPGRLLDLSLCPDVRPALAFGGECAWHLPPSGSGAVLPAQGRVQRGSTTGRALSGPTPCLRAVGLPCPGLCSGAVNSGRARRERASLTVAHWLSTLTFLQKRRLRRLGRFVTRHRARVRERLA